MAVVETVVVAKGFFEENCYLVVCPETGDAAVIDPGALGEREIKAILERAARHGANIRYIINTHGHLDHIAGNREIKKRTGAQILVHTLDAPMLTDTQLNGSAFFGLSITSPKADRLLEDGEEVLIGNTRLTVLHTPGHTRGGICLVGKGFVFSGDTLFAQSVGRTDFPGGSEQQVLTSVIDRLFVLDPETLVYPGHGPSTTIAREKRSNPYFSGMYAGAQASSGAASRLESRLASKGLSPEV